MHSNKGHNLPESEQFTDFYCFPSCHFGYVFTCHENYYEKLESISISQRLRTYPSPNPTVTLTCFPLTVVELRGGGGAGARTFSLYHHSCSDLACSRSWYPITDQYPAILTSRWVSNADIYLSFISIICSLSSAFGTNQCWTFIKPRRESNI